MLSKLLFSLVLAVSPIVSVSAQLENTNFDTFQTADKYLADFDYLNEKSYRVSSAWFFESVFEIDYSGEIFLFYAFPNYYDLVFFDNAPINYYSNVDYNFFTMGVSSEYVVTFEITNFTGQVEEMPFLALDYIGMSQVIDNDYTHGYYDDHTIYGSFYKFFTGFFPEYVVAEYHGIFTFIVVGFLLFLVFGFVFFLFRVIRRLVGFK